jgi:hypothetical protein
MLSLRVYARKVTPMRGSGMVNVRELSGSWETLRYSSPSLSMMRTWSIVPVSRDILKE